MRATTTKRLAHALLVLLLVAGNARSGVITRRLHFEYPGIASSAHGVILEIDGCRSIGRTGEPMLPVYPARFLLPPGERIESFIVEAGSGVPVEGYLDVAPMPAQVRLGGWNGPAAGRNEAVYRSSAPLPGIRGALAAEAECGGYRVAFINIYPCDLVPSSGTVTFYPSVDVTIETIPDPNRRFTPGRVPPLLRTIRHTLENPEAIRKYAPLAPPSSGQFLQPEIIPYVIITGPSLTGSFQSIVNIKEMQGLKTTIVDTESIALSYSGADLQEQIRNFITYAYENWRTEFVLLGGDDEIIPHRGLYVKVGNEIEPDIPSDLYYAALDGNWNSDGDSYYGEPGEEDLLPEVTVGRLPVNTAEDVYHFTAKLARYALFPPENLSTSALMLGELLWTIEDEDTWGGDYKDEILYGTSNFGFTTAGLPPWFTAAMLYDRDLGFPWNESHLLPLLNGGMHIINHIGHCNLHYCMRLSNSEVPLIENTGAGDMPFVIYSQGCHAASFDNVDGAGTPHAEDAIGEVLVTSFEGAVAFIGNTRFGWDSPGSTSGCSQFFDRQFFDALFSEGITGIGRALDDSRIDNIPFVEYAAIRYVMYEQCLFGDPSMLVWTNKPETLGVVHDDFISIGQETFKVTVSGPGGPVENARVSLLGDELNIYCTGHTNTGGVVYLDPVTDTEGVLALSVLAPDHYLYSANVTVTDAPSALPEILYLSFDDDSLGASAGDGDGVIESGETVELDLVIMNTGVEPAEQTGVTLECTDPFVSVIDSMHYIGSLPLRTAIILEKAFIIMLAPETTDGHDIVLNFTIRSDQGEWAANRDLTVSAPWITLQSWAVTDTAEGNGNGCVDAWEFLSIRSAWMNNGSIDVVSPVLSLAFLDDTWARTIHHTVQADTIPAGGSISFNSGLDFFVRELTPPFTDISVILTLSGDNLPACSETLLVTTCGYGMDDPVTGDVPWKHQTLSGIDGWHVSGVSFNSPPLSWKCGNETEGSYSNMMNAVLVSPPIYLYSNSSLTFWHRMEAEAEELYPYWAEDAGVVEISNNGGETWEIVQPAGNYPNRASGSNTIFLPPYTRCYSGQIDWVQAQFDLSAYRGPAIIRFHFASNEQYGFDGWYIDDVEVTTDLPVDIGDDTPGSIHVNRLSPAYPNPFNPVTTIRYEVAHGSRVELTIYDVAGRRIRTLVDSDVAGGRHEAVWYGTDTRGRPVASGVYFCRLRIGLYNATQRLILLR